MYKFGYLRFLHTFPANMLKKCGLVNKNALFGQKGKNVTGKRDKAFYQTSNYIRAIFWKMIEHIYICNIFHFMCYSVSSECFIFTVRRILSLQLWLNVLGHSLPTKLYIDPYHNFSENFSQKRVLDLVCDWIRYLSFLQSEGSPAAASSYPSNGVMCLGFGNPLNISGMHDPQMLCYQDNLPLSYPVKLVRFPNYGSNSL